MAKTKPQYQYRWSHPIEWLQGKIDDLANQRDKDVAVTELRSIASELAGHLDGDTIQDIFQSEMDADGYFEIDKGR